MSALLEPLDEATSSGYVSLDPSPPSPLSPEADSQLEALYKYAKRQCDAPTECAVCGDPSTCYHYDVASCNGCKTFFRRTVVCGKNYECYNNGKCDLRNGNCRRCRSCRFDQCLRAGMNPLAINLPPNDNTKQILTMIKKRKHRIAEDNDDQPAASTSNAVVPKRPIQQSIAERPIRRLEFLVYLELHCNDIRENSYSTPTGLRKVHLREMMKRKPDLRQALTQHVQPDEPKPPSPYEEVGRRINWMLVDMWLCLDAAKTLPVMEELKFEDQMALIKHIALVNVIITQVFYSVRKNRGTITHPDGVMPIRFGSRTCTNLENEVFNRVTEPFMRIRPTIEEYVLLKAIVWCHPATPDLSEEGEAILEAERLQYTQDLFQCCSRQYGTAVGAKKFADLISVIDAFFHFTQKHRELIVFVRSLYQLDWERLSFGLFFDELLFGEPQ